MINRNNLAKILALRRRSGFPQAELANKLGTTRIQVHMSEKMLRPLPVEAEIKFMELLELYPPAGPLPGEEKEQEVSAEQAEAQEAFKTICKGRLDEVRYQQDKAKVVLAKQHKKYARESEHLRLIQSSMAKYPDDLRLVSKRNTILKKLKSCDALARMQTQYEIDLYEVEENLLLWKLEESG